MSSLLFKLPISLCFLIYGTATAQNSSYINPTGTYNYGVINKNEKKQGYFAEMQVVSLASDKIIVSIVINKGYPSFNNGSFIDTLTYQNNKATYYLYFEAKTECKIDFIFSSKSALVKESNEKDNCDFGNGVYADFIMKKKSSLMPRITDLAK